MDGTMAGYYIREGSNPGLFAIHLKGGGACMTKEECDARIDTRVGSSKDWYDSKVGDGFLSQDCDENPDFCEATAVHIPYCTSDAHRGNNDEPSELSFGYYFDGHLNFKAIIEKLVTEKGLGDATGVLLTGGSAGAIGATFNVDWLADRLPDATVKAAPSAGWYLPNALDDDLPEPHNPSDYDHFARGENGNPTFDAIEGGGSGGALMDVVWKIKDSLSSDCLEAFGDDQWWACVSSRWAYKFIKSPIYHVHTQYDSNQIFSGNQAPQSPVDDEELDTVKRYVQMWGNATRESFEETIVADNIFFPKAHKDGVFSASCITHGTPKNVAINGYYANQLIHDWFFQNGQYEDQYKLIETCDPLEGNEEYVIPCNVAPVCAYTPKPGNDEKEKAMKCAKRLDIEGCLESFAPRQDCFTCVRDNINELLEAGCTSTIVRMICIHAEDNGIFDEFNGSTVVIRDVDLGDSDEEFEDIFDSDGGDPSDSGDSSDGSSSGAVSRVQSVGSRLILGISFLLVVFLPLHSV